MTMNSDAIAVLQLQATRGLGNKSLARIFLASQNNGESLTEIVGLATSELEVRYDIRSGIADGIELARVVAERLAESLQQNDVSLLVRFGPGYPQKLEDALGDEAPAVLFAHGDPVLLNGRTVGVSGSRRASNESLNLTRSLAGELARDGVNVVSGNANGVDLAAHHGALAVSGATTFVLAEGILSYRPRGEVAEVFDDGQAFVISEFPPELGWIARNAMRRNRTICGLSQALVIVEASDSGGTFAAGQEALKLGCPLFVANHSDLPETANGNRKLIRAGARPMELNEDFQLKTRQLLDRLTEIPWQEERKPQLPLL